MRLGLLNGEILPEGEIRLPWTTHGLRQGFGLFETIRVASGRPFLSGHHAQRLTESAPELGIDPWMHPRTLTRAIDKLVERSEMKDAALRLFLLPGTPPPGEEGTEPEHGIDEARSHRARDPRALYLGSMSPYAHEPSPGARAVIAGDLRDARGPLVGIKTISYAGERILLGRAQAMGADEALRRNLEGRITEGTRSNIFLIEKTRLVTPPLAEGLLAGITRWFLLRIAPECGLLPYEELVPVERLLGADEAFLASSLRGVVPLVAVDGASIGSGIPGPWTERLRTALERHIVG